MKKITLKMGSNVALLLALFVFYPAVASAQEEIPAPPQPQPCNNPKADREVVFGTVICYTSAPWMNATSRAEAEAQKNARREQESRYKDLLAVSQIFAKSINAVNKKIDVAETTGDIKKELKGICKRNNSKYKPREMHPGATKHMRRSFMPVAMAAKKFLDAVNQIHHINQIPDASLIIAVSDMDRELSSVCGGDYCDDK